MTGSRRSKDALFDALASVAKAVGSGRRAEILELLAQREHSVEQIAAAIDQSIANTSHHLQILARAGLVTSRREGTRVIYRLSSDDVAALWAAVRTVATKHLATIGRLADDYLGARHELEAISREELLERMHRGDVVVWDVRPVAEYEAGHVAGAQPVPLARLQRELRELADDADVVAYCRGPYCVYADHAVRKLRARGVRARRLEDGFPEWQRAGYPTAGTTARLAEQP